MGDGIIPHPELAELFIDNSSFFAEFFIALFNNLFVYYLALADPLCHFRYHIELLRLKLR